MAALDWPECAAIAATLTVLGAPLLGAGRQDRPFFRSSTRQSAARQRISGRCSRSAATMTAR